MPGDRAEWRRTDPPARGHPAAHAGGSHGAGQHGPLLSRTGPGRHAGDDDRESHPGQWRAMRQRHTQGDAQIRALWEHAHALKDSYEDLTFTPPHLATIQSPTLIVHGDRGLLSPVGLAVEMYAAIPGSYLWVIPNGGHRPIFGDRAEMFRENALAFLRGAWKGDLVVVQSWASVQYRVGHVPAQAAPGSQGGGGIL